MCKSEGEDERLPAHLSFYVEQADKELLRKNES